MQRISIGRVAEICRSRILGFLLPYRWQSLYIWTSSVMSSCSFGRFKVRLTRWSVKVRSCCVSCRRLEVPYLKELQLSFPPWQVRRGLSIHLGSTNIDPDSLVSLVCYLANQGSSCNDLSCVGSAFRTIAMSMSRPGIVLALSSLMRRERVSTSTMPLDWTNLTLLPYLEREATTLSADGLIADEAESYRRNR